MDDTVECTEKETYAEGLAISKHMPPTTSALTRGHAYITAGHILQCLIVSETIQISVSFPKFYQLLATLFFA